jgi:RimJ/RimL family protein N-acetyltransferase
MPSDNLIPPYGFFEKIMRSNRLVLKPYEPARDQDSIITMFSDPSVYLPLGFVFPKILLKNHLEGKLERLNSASSGDWSVFLIENDRESFAGEAGIASWDPESQIVELFCAVYPDCRQRGIGRESVSLLVEACFQSSPVLKPRIQAMKSNENSIKLGTSLGFSPAGTVYAPPDPEKGFEGGFAVILDLSISEFKKFRLKEN